MDPRVQKIVALLEARPDARFSVPELAREVNLSQWHLTHLFVSEIQMSPLEYSRRLKFERATDLLTHTFLSIKEVMSAVGFHDKSHFARDFKRLYGLGPSEYRRQHNRGG